MAAAKLAQDQHPESRYHGRRIMLQLLEYPDLMDTLKRQLKPANFKAVHDIIENLKLRVSELYFHIFWSILFSFAFST